MILQPKKPGIMPNNGINRIFYFLFVAFFGVIKITQPAFNIMGFGCGDHVSPADSCPQSSNRQPKS